MVQPSSGYNIFQSTIDHGNSKLIAIC